MRIIEEYSSFNPDLLEISSASYIGDYAIRLNFSDGTQQLVDFKPSLEASMHPSIRKYLDEERFKQFEIVNGNLNWNDFDLIFPLEDLHDGKVK
jgi:hypothetical protein